MPLFRTFLRKKHTSNGRAPPIPLNIPPLHMPSEEELHEGTWLQWPHDYDHSGKKVKNQVARYEKSWVKMVQALVPGERVHIIVYNSIEKIRVQQLLSSKKQVTPVIDMTRVDFFEWPTNDVWIRDNGPVFVFDNENQLCITDWQFNGWGNKADWELCNNIPAKVTAALKLPCYSVPMVNEGGSVEIDGKGTLMAKRSSILNKNRNPGWTQQDAEAYFRKYLGVSNFIWLDGRKGGDITDDHIDGTARFAGSETIVTYYRRDFLIPKEYDVLSSAKNADGNTYRIVHLPVTKSKKIKGEYGIYINYYIGNQVVLAPKYNDPSDEVAYAVLSELYPTRTVLGIDFTEPFKDGGLMHCVTQQQPAVPRR